MSKFKDRVSLKYYSLGIIPADTLRHNKQALETMSKEEWRACRRKYRKLLRKIKKAHKRAYVKKRMKRVSKHLLKEERKSCYIQTKDFYNHKVPKDNSGFYAKAVNKRIVDAFVTGLVTEDIINEHRKRTERLANERN